MTGSDHGRDDPLGGALRDVAGLVTMLADMNLVDSITPV